MEEVKEGVRPKTAERRDIVKEQHPLSLSRRVYDRTLRGLLYLCAGLTCALLLFLIGYIFYRGLPHITWELVSTQESILNDTTGILPSILNTVYVVVVTMLVVLPLGVGAAVYLTEYASNRRLVAAIEFATETLAGIPSIIYAMVGVLIFSQFMSLGKTLLAASLTLVILTLPTIIRTTQESLKTVPQSYREGSLGLGSGKWHMIRTVVLPNSIDGIVTGCILAVGRIVGESAVLMFTAGMSTTLNRFFVWNGDLGASLAQTWLGLTQSSGATLTVALYVFAKERAQFDIAFAIGAILMIITLLINLCAKLVGKKLKK
ncbi:phosphate ABC transporter permease PstA [Eubacteriales bacterium SGI.150]|jgi:phosphate transport system permease protein